MIHTEYEIEMDIIDGQDTVMFANRCAEIFPNVELEINVDACILKTPDGDVARTIYSYLIVDTNCSNFILYKVMDDNKTILLNSEDEFLDEADGLEADEDMLVRAQNFEFSFKEEICNIL